MEKKLLCVLFSAILSLSFMYGQEYITTFTSQRTGSQVSAYPLPMKGEAKIPANGHVWILAHLEGFEGWYPQGNGERTLKDSKWTCAVHLGTPAETGFYEIAIAVVSDEVNQSLNNWVRTAQEKNYPPIPFPDILNCCPITTIRVEKR
jgi:hypothetical protein